MPIRINLLAEAQAAEEIRRRDPVKRAIWVGIAIVSLFLCWGLFLWGKTINANSQLTGLMGSLNSRTNKYTQILSDKQRLATVTTNLAKLNQFATNRFLYANALDAIQHAVVDGVHMTKLQVEQAFDVVPETKASVTESGARVPGKPGKSTERTKIIIAASDTSEEPGILGFNKLKGSLLQSFQDQHISTNAIRLMGIAPPQVQTDTGKPYVMFNLELVYPDRTR